MNHHFCNTETVHSMLDIDVARCNKFDWVITCCMINYFWFIIVKETKNDLIIGQKAVFLNIFQLIHLKMTVSLRNWNWNQKHKFLSSRGDTHNTEILPSTHSEHLLVGVRLINVVQTCQGGCPHSQWWSQRCFLLCRPHPWWSPHSLRNESRMNHKVANKNIYKKK